MSELSKIKKHAAGIDLGTKDFFVSVDGQNVKSFQTHTAALKELVSYLIENSITTVAMESTGILWLPLYDLLENAGIEVFLVNAAHARNIPTQNQTLPIVVGFKDCTATGYCVHPMCRVVISGNYGCI
jgi:transposase